jgi:type IV pilus assembly protein PilY1
VSYPTDQVRFGLSILGTTFSINAARIVVPLGPSRANTFPGVATEFAKVRQLIIDVLNKKQQSGLNLASGSTPMAGALFNLGQYFTKKGRNVYANAFGSAFQVTAYDEDTAGLVGATLAPWASGNCSVCWGCQTSSILIVTDGSPNSEMTWPTSLAGYGASTYSSQTNCGQSTGYTGASAYKNFSPNTNVPTAQTTYIPPTNYTQCRTAPFSACCSPSDGNSTPPSYMPRIAYWLNNPEKAPGNDLRPEFDKLQNLSVYTVSFGVRDRQALAILTATANMGGGKPYNAQDKAELQASVASAVNDVVTRATSFSAPAASSLSTIHTVSAEAYVTRFRPNDTATWEGHVFQAYLFDEFISGCDPTKEPGTQAKVKCGPKDVLVDPNLNGDATTASPGHPALNICTGVFLVDQDCSIIDEDPITGAFVKIGSGGVEAKVGWDAGKVLSNPSSPGYRSAAEGAVNSRKILTAIPRSGGGFEMVPFDTVKADLDKFMSFMSLDVATCTQILQLAKLCSGTTACATYITANPYQCAYQVVDFVRGWDVRDDDGDGCFGPHNAAATTCLAGEQRDRWTAAGVVSDRRTTPLFWKLGDIFHSAPVVVKAPVIEPICDTGYDNQCVATIHSPPFFNGATVDRMQTKIQSDYTACRASERVDAYEAWRYDIRDRQRVLLAGANDGMLHAFSAGRADKTKAADTIFCNWPYDSGTGEEVWAFIPPDMLPRLKDTLLSHQYLVDGNTMVRDVWVDINKDGVKQKNEFRTVAILSERAGGTQYTALDVTDVLNPVMLWTFPPPCSDDAKYMGQSWTDFAPRPPPIGPVKIQLASGAKDALGRGFEERWIAMLNGGYDPTMVAGRAVWMVDVWTGNVIWRYTDDDFKAQNGYGSATSMFPVPAAVAMMDMGDPSTPRFDGDGYFDTATWGDLGGSIFVSRFAEPGVLDPTTGRATNWFAARTFEEQRRTDDAQFAQGRSPIFFMTSNTYDPQGKALHTYVGGGNRERIMQQGEGCGPDNLFGCCRAGCSSVSATTTDSYGTCNFSSGFSCTNGQMFHAKPTAPTSACAGNVACSAFTTSVSLQFTCPSVTRSITAGATCDAAGVCSSLTTIGEDDVGASFTAACPKNRFFSVLAYGGHPEKTFYTTSSGTTKETVSGAVAFEKSRYTDATFTGSGGACASTGGSCSLIDTTLAQTTVNQAWPTCLGGATKCWATATDPGWYYEYGGAVKACADCVNTGCRNEKTGSSASIVFGCTLWNGFQPVGSTGGTDPCSGTVGLPLVFGYASDYLSGVPSGNCGYNAPPDSILYRAAQRNSVAPPSGGIFRVSVSAKGEVAYSALQMDPGAPPSAVTPGTRSDIAEPVYWLEVPRDLHNCRHDKDKTGTACD